MNEQKPVVLKNIRIHGVGEVIDSSWFEIGETLTFFSLPDDFNRKGFLQALQTINPPYACREKQPFRDYPLIIRQGKYQKRVRPGRRTIAFAIFVAQPRLVMELAGISPVLYEADRIEVGRRLDYSRWINFVEIAGSTRWSEVEEAVFETARRYPASLTPQLEKTIRSLCKSDRVKDTVRELLGDWLQHLLAAENDGKRREELTDLHFSLQRQAHFQAARAMVKQRLPLFHLVDGELAASLGSHKAVGAGRIHSLDGHIAALTAQEEKTRGIAPLLLIDEPDLGLKDTGKEALRNLMRDISKNIQCLYLISESGYHSLLPADRVVTLADMLS